ncbi:MULTISPECIES: helix-turn-helix domain-containing protein [unclassified Chryseobacterium]|uniref:helix-turn-helix domain-containing protein n=1 Tax=unclassified Chryseobacterium TaxID=2593645 RepID=UPI00100B98BE|nr:MULTISPECIES: AraC family transcriptional regulator [unclassified Chryseobacterium]RXM53222.1 hypothetical protein BOQ64_02240 [Chryseobacterium sp. CH25]RXM65582.1 hypothetical protein BOQ60_07255 [Chryseobacterium sp. CH1]
MKHLSVKYVGSDIIYIECNGKNVYRIDDIIKKENFISIFLFEKGNGTHTIGSENYLIKEKQVHMVLPGQKQEFSCNESAVLNLIMVSKCKYIEIMGGVQIPSIVCQEYPVVDVSQEIFDILAKEYRDVASEIMEESCVMMHIIYSKIKIILQNISREIRRTCGGLRIYEQHPLLFTFIVLIKKHFKEDRSVSFYASHLGLTANYLNVLCKKHLKNTASRVIDMEVIPLLKRDIITSEDLLINIAYDYSFQNYVHFSRYFKKYVGLSPMAYRRKKLLG